MKKRKIRKILLRFLIILLSAVLIFTIGTFIYHRIASGNELSDLKEKGYYNLVSVGDYSLNVSKFGNEKGKHRIIGMAGMGMGDYSVAARQMTAELEKDDLVVFVDRAGYGLSDDTDNEMTIDYIIEDYRKALKNAGIKAPYVLMPHSISGPYANYWISKYPDEIEAVAIIDGTQLDDNAADGFPEGGTGNKFYAYLSKLGLERYVIRQFSNLYPSNFTQEEQYLCDALFYQTCDSMAPISEDSLIRENIKKAWDSIKPTKIPKLYITASYGAKTKEDVIQDNKWVNEQIKLNGLDFRYVPQNMMIMTRPS